MKIENIKLFIKAALNIEEVSDEQAENVRVLLDDLSDREERVVRMYYGLDDGRQRSIMEIAKDFEVEEETIKEVLATAIKKCRHPSRQKRFLK